MFTWYFFGWVSGGASNIEKIATILKDLGFKKVVAVFDGDKPLDKERFESKYPEYGAFIIPTEDIRDKNRSDKAVKKGMMTERGELKDDYKGEMIELFNNINSYFMK